MTIPIVSVNVGIQQAPTPNTLQTTYAAISQGATTNSSGAFILLTQQSSLTPYLTGAKAITSLTQTTGLATATCTSPHGFTVGDTIYLTIAGATSTSAQYYNGTFLCTITSTTAFTYVIPSAAPGTSTGTIVYTPEDVTELVAMVTTWFANNSTTALYVLELGAGSPNDGIATLSAWLTANPNGIAYSATFYGFYGIIVPRTWDGNSNFLALLLTFQSTTAKTYFWVTTTLATYSLYPATVKCVIALIESPVFGVYPANALTAISWSGGLVTATTAAAHGITPGTWFQLTGTTPTAYNGWFLATTGTTGSTLVYALTTNPGSETVLGTLVANQYANASIPSTEFTIAAAANVAASYNQSTLIPPFAYSFLYGVTPWPVLGTSALLTTLSNANISVAATAAQGGLPNAMLQSGHTLDGNTFNWWYAIDAANINCNLAISNAVINGSNTNVAPLYDNPIGIHTVQGVAANALSALIGNGVIFGTLLQTTLPALTFAQNSNAGLYNGYCVINAVPFQTYYTANPGQYKTGTYSGLAVSMAPQQGFQNIVFNIQATSFV